MKRYRLLVLAPLTALLLAAACNSVPPMTCQPWGGPRDIAARPSPYDSVSASLGPFEAKVCYSRPATRGRLVFGGLVPFDTLWRTGANEPTIVHLSGPAEIAGLEVGQGDYSIYTVPALQGWTVVVNASTSQWGLTEDAVGAAGNRFPNAYTPDVRRQEVGRASIETTTTEFAERLTATLDSVGESRLDLYFDWATTRIIVPLRFVEPSR